MQTELVRGGKGLPEFYWDKSLAALAEGLLYYNPNGDAVYQAYLRSQVHASAARRDRAPALEHVAGTCAEIIVNQYLSDWAYKYYNVRHNLNLVRENYGWKFNATAHEVTGSMTLYKGKNIKNQIDNLVFYPNDDGDMVPLVVEVKQGVGYNSRQHIVTAMKHKGPAIGRFFNIPFAFMVVVLPEHYTSTKTQTSFQERGGLLAFLPLTGDELQKFCKLLGEYVYGEELVIRS